jgi:uncharacterized membrane protein
VSPRTSGATRATSRLQPRHHPVVSDHDKQRASDLQLRVADWITAFAGSMTFVYVHALTFALWMVFLESNPWPTLTLVVSLEAIFLSTFVLIGQNRQAEFQRAKADHDFFEEEAELRRNTDMTREIHAVVTALLRDGGAPRPGSPVEERSAAPTPPPAADRPRDTRPEDV